jgi:hypothetical protein
MYESQLIAAMNNPSAARAWRKAGRLAVLCGRHMKSIEYWEGQAIAARDRAQTAEHQSRVAALALDRAQTKINNLKIEVISERDKAAAAQKVCDYWRESAVKGYGRAILRRRRKERFRRLALIFLATMTILAWADLLTLLP